MGERLFPNIRKLTTAFCLSIIFLTLGLFALRLTALSDMVHVEVTPPAPMYEMEISGTTFSYRVATTMEFESPEARGTIMAESDDENVFYMRFEIIYDRTGKSVYLSPFLAPGRRITSGYLQGTFLEPGERRSTVTVTVYDPATRRQLDSRAHPVTLIIGED